MFERWQTVMSQSFDGLEQGENINNVGPECSPFPEVEGERKCD